MSLTHAFFEKRQEVSEEYRGKGYQDLDDFLKQTGLTIEDLIKVGILESREWQSTADLLEYRVTEKGKKYFKVLTSMELVLIHKSKQEQLLNLPELHLVPTLPRGNA